MPDAPIPDELLRLREVCALTRLSRATIYRMVAAGAFPDSVQLSLRLVAWRASAVQAWLRELPDSGRVSRRVSLPDGAEVVVMSATAMAKAVESFPVGSSAVFTKMGGSTERMHGVVIGHRDTVKGLFVEMSGSDGRTYKTRAAMMLPLAKV